MAGIFSAPATSSLRRSIECANSPSFSLSLSVSMTPLASDRPRRSLPRPLVDQEVVANLLPLSAYAFLKVSQTPSASATKEADQQGKNEGMAPPPPLTAAAAPPAFASIMGVYHSEVQAYSAAIHHLVYLLEPKIDAAYLEKVRTIGTTDTLPQKDRFRSILSILKMVDPSGSDFLVKKVPLFPPEDIDLKEALKGRTIPFVYWEASDEDDNGGDGEEYEPSDDDDNDEDDDDDDDSLEDEGNDARDVQMEEDPKVGDDGRVSSHDA